MAISYYLRAFFIIMALAFPMQTWSYTLKGRIMDGKRYVSGIEVRVSDKEGNDLGHATTDNRGGFMIDKVEADKIVVIAAGEGYAPLSLEVVTGLADTDLGILNLAKTVDLEEVTVTARSLLHTPGKTMVYASQTDRERAGSPFNMLTILAYKAPQIHVRESERTLTIEGEEPEILVNGVKRSMQFVASIKPDAIEKIEFSTVPDIRFGKRYLNIITRRPVEGGWLMADLTGAVTTPRYFLSGVAEYTKGKNDFMIYYNGGYRNGRKEYTNEEEHYTGGDKDIRLGVEGKPSSTLDRYHNLTLNFTRMASERSMFVATGSLNLHDNHIKTYGTVTGLSEIYDRINKRGIDQIRPALSLYYNLRASSTATVEVNALCSYTDHSSNRDLSYSTGYDSRLSTGSHTWYFSTEALWKQKLPFAWLNTGVSVSHSNASNRYLIDGTSSSRPLSSTRMNIYTSMSGNMLTIGYSLSMGLAYYKVENGMVSPDLMASLQRNLGSNFSISYNFRYNPGMPPASSYNETVTPVNDLMYHIGGGELEAQRNLTNQIQAAFSKNRFYISLQGTVNSISRPLVTDYTYQGNPELPFYGFFLERPGNGRSFMSYGADCNVGVSNLWNFLSLKASAGWGHNRLKAVEEFTECSWYLDLGMGLYWKGWQLNMTAENLVPSWSMWGMNGKIRRWPYTSLAIYRKLGNWNLHVSWSNLFSRYGGRYRTETLTAVAPRSSEFRMNDQGNLVEIGVRYQFTAGKLLSKRRRSINLSGEGDNGIRWDY